MKPLLQCAHKSAKFIARTYLDNVQWLSIALCLAGACGGYILVHRYYGLHEVHGVLAGNRGAVYGTSASLFGSLLGFIIATQAIILTATSAPRLKVVRESAQYAALWTIIMGTIRFLALVTAASIIGLMFDREKAPHAWPFYVVLGTAIGATMRLVASIMILESIIKVLSAPERRP